MKKPNLASRLEQMERRLAEFEAREIKLKEKIAELEARPTGSVTHFHTHYDKEPLVAPVTFPNFPYAPPYLPWSPVCPGYASPT